MSNLDNETGCDLYSLIMIVTFTILATLFYLRHKIKSIWNKGYCKYIIGSFVVFAVSVYLCSSSYPLRSPLTRQAGTNSLIVSSQAPIAPAAYTQFQKYVSKTPLGCLIPVITPYDSSSNRTISVPLDLNLDQITCTDETYLPLMFDTDLQSNLIRLQPIQNGTEWTDCFYRYAIKDESKKDLDSVSYLPISSITFSKTSFPINKLATKIPPLHEVIGIFCHKFQKKNPKLMRKPSLVDVISLVQEMPAETVDKSRLDTLPSTENKLEDKERINILLVILDNVSRMSFIRSFNRTYDFIMTNLTTIDLNGLSITNDVPAFESTSALITGTPWKDRIFQDLKTTPTEESGYIWEQFKKQGYTTALVENCPALFDSKEGAFKFSKKPTDYYPSPWFSLFQTIRRTKSRKLTKTQCHGPRHPFQVLMDYWRRLAIFDDTKGHRRYFMALATCPLTEESIHQESIDQQLLNQIKWLKKHNHLNQSVLIMIGNQGTKSKGVRLEQTYREILEFRMPAGFIVVPHWFRAKYPLAFNNLWKNRRALVTHSDVYQTILDLKELVNLKNRRISERIAELFQHWTNGVFPPRLSLFLPIPKDRDCATAQIDEGTCTCQLNPTELSPEHDAVNSSVSHVLDKINKKLENFSKCSVLEISEVHSAIVESAHENSQEPDGGLLIHQLQQGNNKGITLHLSFSSKPGNGTFDAIVRGLGSQEWTLLEDVTLSEPFKDSKDQKHCISPTERFNPVLQNLCYCN